METNISRLNRSPSLNILEELTGKLPALPELVKSSCEGINTYKTVAGAIIGINLLNRQEIAVSRLFMVQEAILDYHIHPGSIQIFHVLEGIIILEQDNKPESLTEGSVFILQKNTPHKITASVNSWLLIITIPTDAGLPK